MPDFTVIKTFRDRESDLKIFESGSNYVSNKKEWTDYLVKEGFLKSTGTKTTTVKKEEKPKRNTSKKSGE
ncbi:hypothetical protein [Psychrobacillus psychrodurans]|uniref:hypothetical protein n=1 Tax=Psychrobacillus psychrodurans TaxID=126157 RepID=UPI003D032FD7